MQKIHHTIDKIILFLKTIRLTTPTAIVLGSCIIAFGIVGYGFVIKTEASGDTSSIFTGKPIDEKDYVEGNQKSNVIVVAYSDPECPFCISVYPTLKQLREEYKDTVSFVYRHFPLTQIHPQAFDESRAIACAGVIGGTKKFYEYIDMLYGYKADHKTNQLPNTGKDDIARTTGIPIEKYSACMSTNQTENTVYEAINDGIQAGVQGTPSTFILVKKGKKYEVITLVDGARPYSYFKTALEEALSR